MYVSTSSKIDTRLSVHWAITLDEPCVAVRGYGGFSILMTATEARQLAADLLVAAASEISTVGTSVREAV